MDYKHSNKQSYKNRDDYSDYKQPYYKENYNSYGNNNNFSNYNKSRHFDYYEDKNYRGDNQYSQTGKSQNFTNYNNKDSSYGNSSNFNYQNRNIQNDNDREWTNKRSNYSTDDKLKSKEGMSPWTLRSGRENYSWRSLQEEDEKFFEEHLENSAKKESFDQKFITNSKLNVYLNGKQVESNETITEFKKLNLHDKLMQNIEKMGFSQMTPIQQSVIPYLVEGKDVMGCAQTGSGKTVSFLAPIINKMLQDGPPKEESPAGVSSPIGIILAPTRELAEQIYKEARKLVYKTGILVVKVYGGVPIDTQIRNVATGCDIIVATPGRLIDFMGRRMIRLCQIQFLVFDEADRMLEMGFEDQLREIIFSSDIPEKQKRINMMFSATFTPQVREIARSFMNDFYFVTSDLDDEIKVNENIEQTLIYVDEEEKVVKLHEILQKIRGSVIIFRERKKGVDQLAYFLNKRNYNTIAIHGDKSQDRRQIAINSFSNGEIPILIATDVASRGLDFPNVPYVFNFDLPTNIDDYIHRIGRTGRCGNKGTAISFINENCKIARDLHRVLLKSNQKIPDWFESLKAKCESSSSYQKPNYGGYSQSKNYSGFNRNKYQGGGNGLSLANFSSSMSSGSGQPMKMNPRYNNNNFVNVPADYFKKGENFKREEKSETQLPSNQLFERGGFSRSNYGK